MCRFSLFPGNLSPGLVSLWKYPGTYIHDGYYLWGFLRVIISLMLGNWNEVEASWLFWPVVKGGPLSW